MNKKWKYIVLIMTTLAVIIIVLFSTPIKTGIEAIIDNFHFINKDNNGMDVMIVPNE